MYSLLPITEEERVAQRILLTEKPSLIINVLDAKMTLMAQCLEIKPMAYKRRYQVDLSQLTVEEIR